MELVSMTKLGKPESECHCLLNAEWLLLHHLCYDMFKTYDVTVGAQLSAPPSDISSR